MEVVVPVNLSVKNVPEPLVERLRQRAAAHHRLLQGELLSIIEESVAQDKKLKPWEVWEAVRQSGLKTPRESVKILRRDRDER